MEIAGYIASLLIGITLGLIGGGGSILTVPVLVYLFKTEPVTATAYSLFIVGATSLAGSIPKYRAGDVHLKTAAIFGIPAIGAVYAARAWIVPAIPDVLFRVHNWELTKPLFLMLFFALLMVFASLSMIRSRNEPIPGGALTFNVPLILLEGAVTGLLTGLAGAGGGFLIIPALVLLSKLPMKQAIGTSLVIIAAKSLIGFTGDLSNMRVQWDFLLPVTAMAITGIFIGHQLGKKFSAATLKKGFGWFILVMGLYIIGRELLDS